jgi:hypothetical protein
MGQNELQILLKFIDKYATSEHNHSFASDLIIARNLNENTYILLTAIPLKYRIAITYEDRDPALEMFIWTNMYVRIFVLNHCFQQPVSTLKGAHAS